MVRTTGSGAGASSRSGIFVIANKQCTEAAEVHGLRFQQNTNVIVRLRDSEEQLTLADMRRRWMYDSDIFAGFVEWLTLRPGVQLTTSTIERIGLLEQTEKSGVAKWGAVTDDSSGMRYQLKFIMYSERAINGYNGRRYFATDKDNAGLRSYWPIKFCTLSAAPFDYEEGDGNASQASTMLEASTSSDGQRYYKSTITAAQLAQRVDALDKHCVTNPGKPVALTFLGDRNSSSTCLQFHTSIRNICYGLDGQCVRFAMANILPTNDAEKFLNIGVVSKKDLVELSTWMQKNFGRYQLEKVGRPAACEVDDWLKHLSSGKFLISLQAIDEDSDEVYHCISFDADRRLVFDSYEKFAMKAAKGVIEACCGDGCKLTDITDVRRVVRLPENNGRKSRRNPNRKRNVKKARKEEAIRTEEQKKLRVVKRKTVVSGSDED